MTDQRLRDLERDATHGHPQAKARLLLERVRVGDLTEERLRLAACLGDEAARVATSSASLPGVVDALCFSGDPRLLCVAACVGANEVLVTLRAKSATIRHEPAVTDALQAARAWSACPCALHLDAVERTLVRGLHGLSEEAVRSHMVDSISLMIHAELPFGHGISAPPFNRTAVAVDAVGVVRWLLSAAIELCSPESMRSALAAALLPALLAPRGSST